jgi:hypothetical protein
MPTTAPRKTLFQRLRGLIAALRGARPLAYPDDMSRALRAVRLSLSPARSLLQRFPALQPPAHDSLRLLMPGVLFAHA